MSTQSAATKFELDQWLLMLISVLLAGGLVMLTSASISVAERATGAPLYYLQQQLVAAGVGLALGALILRIPTSLYERLGPVLVLGAIVLLVAVLLPGMGNTVNGSTRWLKIGGMSLVQVSEPARLLLLMYLAGYAVRRQDELINSVQGFLKPMLLVVLCSALLMLQPDFGATVVLLAIAMSILLVAGARIAPFAIGIAALVIGLAVLAYTSPYRMERITGFLDPWADPYDSGFQLTQSLIAIGSGEWFGVGLGGSVQKLFYLPEAHTDFVFAVIAEEFGLLGSVLLIALFGLLVLRCLQISRQAADKDRFFQAYLVFGIAIWIGVQSLINIGVNMGVLPTKGLTLPLVSYGRSSLVITLVSLALILRVDLENRMPGQRSRSR